MLGISALQKWNICSFEVEIIYIKISFYCEICNKLTWFFHINLKTIWLAVGHISPKHLCDRGICNVSGALAFFYTTWWGNLHIKHFTWCLKKTGSQLLSPDTHRDPQMNVDTLPTTPADQSPRLKLTHWGSASRCQGPIFKRTLPSYSITFCISSAPITWRSKGNRHAGTLSVMMSELRYAT